VEPCRAQLAILSSDVLECVSDTENDLTEGFGSLTGHTRQRWRVRLGLVDACSKGGNVWKPSWKWRVWNPGFGIVLDLRSLLRELEVQKVCWAVMIGDESRLDVSC
jgi:hypothetical protein